MSIAIYPALVFTVALLVTTAYFLLGGLPLLVLDHDTAVDAKFVRSFFNIYYKVTFITAVGAALSFAALGRPSFAIGAGALAWTSTLLRDRLIPKMDQLGAAIQTDGLPAIGSFRQIHCIALLINLFQLALLVWALLKFSQ